MRDTLTNEMNGKVFEHALLMLQSEATSFAYMFIRDSRLRLQYGRRIKTMSEEMRTAVKNGRLSPREAAHKANYLRNEILMLVRSKNHPILLAYSRNIKRHGKTLNSVLEEKARMRFNQNFGLLNKTEQDAVFLEAIVASGKSRDSVNRLSMVFGRAGKGLFVLTLAIALYEIYESKNKLREAARQTAIAGSGIAGGVGFGTASVATGLCAATSVFCVTIASILGAITAGLGTDYLFDDTF